MPKKKKTTRSSKPQKKVILKGDNNKFWLRRERDGAGDAGPMFLALDPKKKVKNLQYQEQLTVGKPGEIRVGCLVLCGSHYARTFGQDWWRTTAVTKILEVKRDKQNRPYQVKFATGNSEYTAGVVK